MCRYYIYLDLGLVQGDKNELICIPLLTEHQLNKYHALKMLSFFDWMILDLLSKILWPEMYVFISETSILFH